MIMTREAGMGLRMQCLSLALRVNKIWHLYYVLPEPYCLSNKHMWFLYTVNRLCCVSAPFHFNLSCSHCLIKKTVSGVTGKIQTSLPVICARMCMIVPTPSPMVVVYGIARTTVICSVIEAVFSISCMNHVGVVHLKEGEREKKPSIWKIPNNYSEHWFYFNCLFFLPFVFFSLLLVLFFCFLLTCQSGHGTNMPSPCPF